MKKTILFLTISLFSNVLFAQYKQVEKITRQKADFEFRPAEGIVPYTKYDLANGMVVIINEDHSDPLISINLSYRIGSGTDQSDRTGISYLAYLLMQSGTKHFPKGSYENLLKEYSGIFSTKITRDYTSFVSVIPKNLLETSLRMESDRMACMLDSLTEEKFLKVRNDLNSYIQEKTFVEPYGLMETQTLNSLYMYGYPYSWPVYGMTEHNQGILMNDFIKHFLDWYGPNNAILTISGDVSTDKLILLVNKYFGKIQKATNTKPHDNPYSNGTAILVETSISENRFVSYQYDMKNPMLRIVFPTVPKYNEQEVYLNIMADMIGRDSNSFLSKALYKEKLAESVKVTHRTSVLSGEFMIDIVAPADTPLSKVKTRVLALLDSFYDNLDRTTGFDDPSLNHYISSLRTDYMHSFERTSGVTENLFISELYFGNPNFCSKYYFQLNLPSIAKMIRLVIQNYIKSKPAVFISGIPYEKMKLAAAKDNYTPMVLNTVLTHIDKKDLLFRTMPASFNKKVPAIKKIKNLDLPTYNVQKFDNGLQFITIPNKDLNLSTFKIYINLDNYVSNKYFYPLPVIFTELLKDKILNFHQGEFKNITRQLGNSYSIYPYGNNTVIEINATSQDIFMMREILIQIFREMTIPDPNALSKVSSRIFDMFNYENDPLAYTQYAFRNIYNYRPDIKPNFPDGDIVLLKNVGDVIGLFPEILSPKNTTFVFAGNFDNSFLNDFIEQFKQLRNLNDQKVYILNNTFKTASDSVAGKPTRQITLFFIDESAAKSPEILVNYLDLVSPLSENYFTGDFKTFAFEEIFNRKIVSVLNDTKGNFLHVNNFTWKQDTTNFYLLNTNVQLSLLDTSLHSIVEALSKIKTISVDKKEMAVLQNSYFYNQLINCEILPEKADLIYLANTKLAGKKYYDTKDKTIKKIKNADLNYILKQNFNSANIVILVVGNKYLLGDRLKKIQSLNGIPVKLFEIDEFGHSLN